MSRRSCDIDRVIRSGGPTEARLLGRWEGFVTDHSETAWLKTADGRFLAVSGQFAESLGLSHREPDGLGERDAFDECDVARFRADDRRVFSAGCPDVIIEPADSVCSGAWFATVKLPLFDRRGLPVATLGIAEPLGRLAALERKLDRPAGADPAAAERRDWLIQARRTLDARFRDPVRVATLASRFGTHPDYFGRCFRRRFGTSVNRYVAARRVAWAADELTSSDRTVVSIAHDAGFYDQSHMVRSFKWLLGQTPSEYRRRTVSGTLRQPRRETR